MRKVTMVVLVLMTSCQLSEKWKNGPTMAQTTMMRNEIVNATGVPAKRATQTENFRNRSFIEGLGSYSLSSQFINPLLPKGNV